QRHAWTMTESSGDQRRSQVCVAWSPPYDDMATMSIRIPGIRKQFGSTNAFAFEKYIGDAASASNIFERITIDNNQVCFVTFHDLSNSVAGAQQLRGVACGGFQDICWRDPHVLPQLHFAM